MGQALSGVTPLPQRVIRAVAGIGLACVAGVCAGAVAAAADIASKARKLIAVRMVISCGATRLIVNWSPGSKGKKSIPGSGLRRKRMVRRRLSAGWCQRAVIDGGAASGADPHFLFGCGPIDRQSTRLNSSPQFA